MEHAAPAEEPRERQAAAEPSPAGERAIAKSAPARPPVAPAPPQFRYAAPAQDKPAALEAKKERSADERRDAAKSVAPAERTPESRVEAPRAALGRAAPREQESARESAASRAEPFVLRSERPPAGPPGVAVAPPGASAMPSYEPVHVMGQLVVGDRGAAERELTALVARLGGVALARRTSPEGVRLDLSLPRAAFPEFARELARLGRWEPARQLADFPDPVHVGVTLAP
jgi:hypothetical protein